MHDVYPLVMLFVFVREKIENNVNSCIMCICVCLERRCSYTETFNCILEKLSLVIHIKLQEVVD